jgi:hypothetical protein
VRFINAFATSTRITANAMARIITEASYQIKLILIIAPVHHPDASVIILAIAFAVILVLVAKAFIKLTTYRFVLQNKAVGSFSADLNFLIQL